MHYAYPDTGYVGVMWDSPIKAYPLKTPSTFIQCIIYITKISYATLLLRIYIYIYI